MSTSNRTIVGVMMLVICGGCNSTSLSRAQAASLITATGQFAVAETATATTQGRLEGSLQGFWNENGNLTSKGFDYFTEGPSGLMLHPKVALKRKVAEVTGITDAASPPGSAATGLKEVQFRWEYDNAGDVVRRFIVRGGTGRAIMRLFDDGWRLEHVNLQEGNDGFTLNDSERAAADRDREVETERRAAEERRLAEEARIAAEEQQRLARLIEESKTPTRIISTFQHSDRFYSVATSVVTDVGVDSTEYKIWFGELRGNEPEIGDFRQTAFDWTGYAVSFSGRTLVFKDKTERDTFYQVVTKALAAWRSKYPELR